MAREEARIFTAIWQDDDFLALDPSPQRLYLFLLSQPDLSYCGLIALRERRWSKKARNLPVEQIAEDLAALAGNPSPNPSGKGSGNPSGTPFPNPFLVIDDDTEEVFVRSFIRRDGIWKQPNLLKAAREAAGLIESPKIRAALLEELLRLPELMTSDLGKSVLAEFISNLSNREGNPSPNPSQKGSENPSPSPSSDPSQGKGEGYGDVVVGSPNPRTPSPVPPSAGADAPRADVERLCTHLADRIEANGSNRPNIGKGWRDAARLMLDKDGRTEGQVRAAIDWCQADEFWRGVVMSMPKLRDKYDQLRLQARRTPGPARQSGQSRNAQNISAARQRAIEAEIRMGLRPDPTKTVQGELAP